MKNKQITQGLEGEELFRHLQANAEETEVLTYMRKFTDEELIEKKELLSETVIEPRYVFCKTVENIIGVFRSSGVIKLNPKSCLILINILV